MEVINCDELFNTISNLTPTEYNNKYNELINIYPNNKDKIDLVFYDLYNYETEIRENIEETIEETTEEKIKRKDEQFKKEVRDYYETCIVTGRSLSVCEVAHIFPFKKCEDKDKYNKYNGLLLCCDLHQLFDNNLIKINTIDFKLILDEQILKDKTLEDYHKYHGKILNIRTESREYLMKLYN